VSCFGEAGIGDIADEWTIVLRYDEERPDGLIRRISDPVLLVHGIVGETRICALATNSKSLPSWGQEQVGYVSHLLADYFLTLSCTCPVRSDVYF
jgi:hypothetical protein